MKYNFSFYGWVCVWVCGISGECSKIIEKRRSKYSGKKNFLIETATSLNVCALPSTLMVCHCLLYTHTHVVSLERKLWKWFFFREFLQHCRLNDSVYDVVMSKRSQLDYCYRFIIKIEPTKKKRTERHAFDKFDCTAQCSYNGVIYLTRTKCSNLRRYARLNEMKKKLSTQCFNVPHTFECVP